MKEIVDGIALWIQDELKQQNIEVDVNEILGTYAELDDSENENIKELQSKRDNR